MREILFRGKRVDNGEWEEGFHVRLNGKEHRIYTGHAETDCGDYYPDWWQVDPESVGQYTGLKDSNGKRIFEGDIFEWRYVRYVATFDAEMASFVGERGFGFVTFDGIDIEIIGNIHDNPELLKGGE